MNPKMRDAILASRCSPWERKACGVFVVRADDSYHRTFFQQATTSKRRRLNAESAQAEIQDSVDNLMEFIDEEQKKNAMSG
jgi:hypothetical protein